MIYLIKKGNHYSSEFIWRVIANLFSPILFFKKISFKFKLDKSCNYQLNPETDGLQWNKLFGVASFGLVHTNSIRIGWRTNLNKTEICFYTYQKGIRTIVPTFECKLDTFYECRLELKSNKIILNIKDDDSNIHTFYQPYTKKIFYLAYKCFPYFGGETPSPKDLKITINKL